MLEYFGGINKHMDKGHLWKHLGFPKCFDTKYTKETMLPWSWMSWTESWLKDKEQRIESKA